MIRYSAVRLNTVLLVVALIVWPTALSWWATILLPKRMCSLVEEKIEGKNSLKGYPLCR